MNPPFTFEPQFAMGLQIPDSYFVQDGAGQFLCECWSAGTAQELVNLLNLTTQEQRDQALRQMYGRAA